MYKTKHILTCDELSHLFLGGFYNVMRCYDGNCEKSVWSGQMWHLYPCVLYVRVVAICYSDLSLDICG